MQSIYETERLILKVLDKSHGELVLDYYIRNQIFNNKRELGRPYTYGFT